VAVVVVVVVLLLLLLLLTCAVNGLNLCMSRDTSALHLFVVNIEQLPLFDGGMIYV